jgi:poly(beta-D-mannuronate) lyase
MMGARLTRLSLAIPLLLALTATTPVLPASAGPIGPLLTWESTADSAAAFPSGVHQIGTTNTRSLQLDFDVTAAAAPINGVVGYADSSTPVTEYADFAVAVRFSSAGYFDARDGAGYARAATLTYVPGRTYHVRIVVDVPGRSYSVDITPSGSGPVRIASGYTFRIDSPETDDFGQVGVKSDTAGQFRVDNHTVTALNRPDGIPAANRTVRVTSLSGLTNAVASAQPGDHIILANNTYTTSGRITLRARGTFDAPIVVTAESIGGVTIGGDGGFLVDDSSYLVIRGFVFRHGTEGGLGLEINTSDHVRVSRNLFALRNGSAAKWLLVNGGSKVRIDHNRFENKTTESSLLLVDPDANDVLATYALIDHNYFRAVSTPNDDTGEAVRIGWSGAQNQSGYAVVQHNLFEDCDGDAEVISNKSSDNLYRHNTFRSNRGSLVLRHGDRARVEGNYFLSNTGGFRMYGDNHTVLGNYFSGNNGSLTSVLATFVIGSGTTAADGSDTDGAEYDQPNGGTIAFNTLVANTNHFVIGRGSGQPLAARNIRFGNNIAVGSSGELVYYYGNAPQNFTWEGNILHGTARGDIPSGYRIVDPQFTTGTDGVRRLTSASPARDAAASSTFYTTTNTDLDGHPRAEPKDTGADEYSTAPIQRHPLSPTDVGPSGP